MNYLKLLRNNVSFALGLCVLVFTVAVLLDFGQLSSHGAVASLWTFLENYADRLAGFLFIAVTLPLAFQNPHSVDRE